MQKGFFLLKQSDPALIDCEIILNEEDKEVLKAALKCYDTYQETIENSGVVEKIGDKVHFEIFGEDFKPPLGDLTEKM
jgi:hypothetical protein